MWSYIVVDQGGGLSTTPLGHPLAALDTNLLGLGAFFITFLNISLRKTNYSPESQQPLGIPLVPVENVGKPVEKS